MRIPYFRIYLQRLNALRLRRGWTRRSITLQPFERLETRFALSGNDTGTSILHFDALSGFGTYVEVAYTITGASHAPIHINLVESTDAIPSDDDTLIATLNLNGSDETTVGGHRRRVYLDSADPELQLPSWSENSLQPNHILAYFEEGEGTPSDNPNAALTGFVIDRNGRTDASSDRTLRFFGTTLADEIRFDLATQSATWNSRVFRWANQSVTDMAFATYAGDDSILIIGTHATGALPRIVGTAGEGIDQLEVRGTVGHESVELGIEQTTWTSESFNLFALGFEKSLAVSGGGDDSMVFYDTGGNDQLTVSSDRAYIQGANYLLYQRDFTTLTVNAVHGIDTAQFFDSSGNDTFETSADAAFFRTAHTLSAITGFDVINMQGGAGGHDTATLYESALDDTLTLTSSTASLRNASGFTQIRSFGNITIPESKQGNDRAVVSGSAADDLLVAYPGHATFQSGELVWDFLGYARIEVTAGVGGNDLARFYDSAANDVLYARPASTYLQGPDFLSYAAGFDQVEAYASDGNDIALFWDSSGADVASSSPARTYLTGPGYTNFAQGFDRVDLYSTLGGQDSALLEGSPGDDRYTVRSSMRSLSGPGYTNRAIGFISTEAFASQGGADSATFYDSALDDTFVASPSLASIQNDTQFSSANYFETVYAYATAGGFDLAQFFDSPRDDVFAGRPTGSYLSGNGYLNYAGAFEQVEAYASSGNDIAMLWDSSGNDRFEANRARAFLQGDGFLNFASGFDFVDAYHSAGGTDVAAFQDAVGDDTFLSTDTVATMQGSGYRLRSIGFGDIQAVADQGGNDVATLTGSSTDDRLEGQLRAAWFQSGDVRRFVEGFEEVHATAGVGGDDIAWLMDSIDDETLLAIDAVGAIGDSSHLLWASDFDRIVFHRSGGDDSIEFSEVRYTLETDGDWPDRLEYKPMPLDDARIVALRQYELPAIYVAYGLTQSSPEIDRIDALRDWVARTAIHPTENAHEDTTTGNLGVLPEGNDWSDVNNLETPERLTADVAFWTPFKLDGYAILDALLGVLNPLTGQRDATGMMERLGPAHYRIRSLDSYHFVQCTNQTAIFRVLLAAAGFQSVLIATNGHDTTAVYVPELDKWVWECPTFNERLATDESDAASPVELLQLSRAGIESFQTIRSIRIEGPAWDRSFYGGETGDSYFDQKYDPVMTYLLVSLQGNTLGGVLALDLVQLNQGENRFPEHPTVSESIAFPAIAVSS